MRPRRTTYPRARRPAILINAGDSDSNDGQDSGLPVRGEAPNDRPLSRRIDIPGYNHIDVLSAARRQNDGRPEPSARALTDFGLAAIARLAR